MKFNIELMNNAVPFCVNIVGRTKGELKELECELIKAFGFEIYEEVHEVIGQKFYGVDSDAEFMGYNKAKYFSDTSDLEEVKVFEWKDILLESEKVITEESSFEVGHQVTISNAKGYNLGEFGEQFLGEICTVRSLFESSNANEGSIEMVVVSLEDGTCGCFRSDMVSEFKPTWQEQVKEYLDAILRDIGNLDTEWEINRSGLVDEEFLGMCRVALRAKGEIE